MRDSLQLRERRLDLGACAGCGVPRPVSLELAAGRDVRVFRKRRDIRC